MIREIDHFLWYIWNREIVLYSAYKTKNFMRKIKVIVLVVLLGVLIPFHFSGGFFVEVSLGCDNTGGVEAYEYADPLWVQGDGSEKEKPSEYFNVVSSHGGHGFVFDSLSKYAGYVDVPYLAEKKDTNYPRYHAVKAWYGGPIHPAIVMLFCLDSPDSSKIRSRRLSTR
jgi:hypothetical protein